MLNDLLKLTPDENSSLIALVFRDFNQPFSIMGVTIIHGTKLVQLKLRSGLVKTYQVLPTGRMIRIQK